MIKETNMEHFKNELEQLVKSKTPFGVLNGKPEPCHIIGCSKCEIESGHCVTGTTAWLMSEYKAEPVLTAREMGFAECIKYGYIARDHEGTLEWYKEKPQKLYGCWLYSRDQTIIYLNREMFSFISWEDEEPWSVEELRKLKVK